MIRLVEFSAEIYNRILRILIKDDSSIDNKCVKFKSRIGANHADRNHAHKDRPYP